MNTYKLTQNSQDLDISAKEPSIRTRESNLTIATTINLLNSLLNCTALIQEGTPIATVNDTLIYLPEMEAEINIESAVYFNNLAHLVDSGLLYIKAGDVAITKGFYKPNDGGGSTYIIRSSVATRINGYALENMVDRDNEHSIYIYNSPIIDGVSLILLADNLYAELLIPEGEFVNIRQLGALSLEDGVKVDNKEFMDKARVFIQRKKYFHSIFIPPGHWCFSPTLIQYKIKTSSGYSSIEVRGENAILMPFKDSLDYIFKIGTYNSKVDAYTSRGMELRNLTFQCGNYDLSPAMKALYGNTKYVNTAALYIENATYSSYIDISFKYIFNTALFAISDYESHFERLKFHCCGAVRDGNMYPVIKLDLSGYSYASAVSANWFTFIHFNSCVGSYIYGGAQNNGHNEFNCILVTGSSDEYQLSCPDVASEETNTTKHYGVVDYYLGMTNHWPNCYITVMSTTAGISVKRDNTIYITDSILHHENAVHCHTYLGNIVTPAWVVYVTKGSLVYSVRLLFDEKDKPFYILLQKLPKHHVKISDLRLIWANCNGDNYVLNSSSTENPLHMYVVGNSDSDLTVFLAKAGQNYGLKFYKEKATGGYWINQTDTKYKIGLYVYLGEWKYVSANQITTLDGSDGNWRFGGYPKFFCFKEDTLVRISGGGYEFFYEKEKYPTDLINLILLTNNITSKANTTATYQITKSNDIKSISVTVSNSKYFSASISNDIITLTTQLVNNAAKDMYTCIMLTGKDADGKTITKTSFISVKLPIDS